VKSILVEVPVLKPTEDMIFYKCRNHCQISDFNALKEEFKNEMSRFNNVKKYVKMLTARIEKHKRIMIQLVKI